MTLTRRPIVAVEPSTWHPGSRAIGERNGQAKLRCEEVYEIDHLLCLGVQQVKIAAKFGVHQTMVSLIKTRKKWRHLWSRQEQ